MLIAAPLVVPRAVAAPQAPAGPNVLLIVADDEPDDLYTPQFMPAVFSQIVGRGVDFSRAYVGSSLCCPSRSQMLTGLAEPRTGVDENDIALSRPTLPMALHDAGYRTAMIGKYLNSWNTCAPRPEFDRWGCVASGKSSYTLVNPWINDDGTWAQQTGYQPDLLADRVIDFISSTPADKPFFAMYTPTTPHLPANGGRYASLPVPNLRSPSYDEETRTPDHPTYLRGFPMTASEKTTMDNQHRVMGRATRALDDSIARMLSALGSRADDTIVIFISDNGYQYGEHRRTWKAAPFEESIHVPMAIRFPSALAPSAAFVSSALVGNVDIAPTVADAAGIEWHADGRSLLPLLSGSSTSVRNAFFFSRCIGIRLLTEPCRGIGWYPTRQTAYPSYEGVVTADSKLIRYPLTGEEQLFDLTSDPWELHNLAGQPAVAGLQANLEAMLDGLLAPPPIDTTIVSGPTNSIAAGVATFRYFSPPRASTYRCRLSRDGVSGAWFACNGEQATIGGLGAGDYLFEVAGSHRGDGTDATPAQRAFSIGTSGPPVTLTAMPPAAQRSRSAAFDFTSPTTGATFACRLTKLDGPVVPWSPCSAGTGASYSGLADGLWNFEVRATDPVSGDVTNPPASWLVRIDNVGPTWLVEARPPTVTGSTDASLRFAPLEAIGGAITCRLDSKPVTNCSDGGFSVSGLTAAKHTITIAAADDLGNTSTQPITWTVDRTPPTVAIRSRPSASATNPSFTFSATGGTAYFRCTLDTWAPTPCHTTQALGTLSLGTHTLTVQSIDKAFNMSAPLTYTWTITG